MSECDCDSCWCFTERHLKPRHTRITATSTNIQGAEINNTGQYIGFTVSLGVWSSFTEAHGEITYTNVYNITELLKFWGLYDTAYQTVRDYYNKLTCEQKNYFKDSFDIEFK